MSIKTILADDHAVVRNGLRLVLETAGDIAVVGEAADGRAALHLVRDLSPDVVVMDVTMPLLNGIEATQQIMELYPATRVVMLSMHAAAEHVSRALRAGAMAYVLKESAAREVIDAIRAAHTGKRYLSQQIAGTFVDDYLQRLRESSENNPLDLLSPREREVLQLVVEGKSSAEIAKMIHLSPKTVETYRSRLMQKLGLKCVPSLVKFALRHALTTPY